MAEPSTPNTHPEAIAADAVKQRLDRIRAYRGKLMPNHAVLAIEFPQLLETYEALYAGTTLTFNVLSPREKKFVLLVVVASAEISLGAHHVADFLKVGGTATQVDAAVRLALFVVGSRLLAEVESGWHAVVPSVSYERAWQAALAGLPAGADLSPELVELAATAGQATRRSWDRVAFHLQQAKAKGAGDAAIAEALTTLILPVGNPLFVLACGVWQRLVASGTIDASPLHRYAARGE